MGDTLLHVARSARRVSRDAEGRGCTGGGGCDVEGRGGAVICDSGGNGRSAVDCSPVIFDCSPVILVGRRAGLQVA